MAGPVLRLPHIRLRTVLVHLAAWGIGVAWLVPFLGVAMVAFRPLGEVPLGWWNLSPFNPTLANFAGAWGNSDCPLSMGIRNSLLVAVPSTFMPLMVDAFAGYGFARYRFPGRGYVFLSVVLLLAGPQKMVPPAILQRMLNAGLLNPF